MAKQSNKLNRIAPWRFILFFALLIIASAAGVPFLGKTQGFLAGFDLAALVFLLSCIPTLTQRASAMRLVAERSDANRVVLLVISALVTLVTLSALVAEPFDKGGWGALQINGRIDYLDLSDRVDDGTPNVGTPFANSSGLLYVNGGKQTAYQLSAIWNPTDYVRFMAQYAHINVKGGPRPSISTSATPTAQNQIGMFPFDATPDPITERDFDSDVFAMRAQIDF